jgi:DNA-binding CsgD family transcriptional regulator
LVRGDIRTQGATVRRIDNRRLERACDRLGEVVIDPTKWPEVMESICSAVGATGAALLQSDVRSPDVPRTASVDELFSNYFRYRWHLRDRRAERAVPLLLNGAHAVVDQDILRREEIDNDEFYCEALLPFGFKWFAVVGMRVGSAHWGLSFQRTTREGPFSLRDKAILANIAPRLSETASLSVVVGRVALASATNALNAVRQPAIALDQCGFVLEANPSAETIFDEDLHINRGRLIIRDAEAKARFEKILEQLRVTPETAAPRAEPIVIPRSKKGSVIARTLPVPCAARNPFLGARALLVFAPIGDRVRPGLALLMNLFGLTPAEARLASAVAGGIDPARAAEEIGISRVTARNQLRAIFAKTGTHRQSELVALLSRI